MDDHRYVCLATVRRNGVEVKTPVWFAAVGEKLYVFTAGEAGKVKRLRHSPRYASPPAMREGECRAPGGTASGAS